MNTDPNIVVSNIAPFFSETLACSTVNRLVCVCVCVCVCVRERQRVCVCVCERERQRVCVCESGVCSNSRSLTGSSNNSAASHFDDLVCMSMGMCVCVRKCVCVVCVGLW